MSPALLDKLLRLLIFPTLRVLAIAYVVFLLLLYFNQSQLIYRPSREVVNTPKTVGLDYQDVQLVTQDQVKLSAWFVPARNKDTIGKAVILYCHGNGGNISNRLSYLPIFHSENLATFIFDYRGYGHSEGIPTETGTYADVEAAWQYLTVTKQIPAHKIIIYGESLGGAIATYIAQKHQVGGLILASTFTAITDRAAELYPFFPIRWISIFSYNSLERMPTIKTPVLVIHSIEDRIVPFHHGQALYEAANQPKMFVQIQGDHNNGFIDSLTAYRAGIEKFVEHLSI